VNVALHALAPVTLIVCATVLAALHVIDPAAWLAVAGASGAAAVPIVARAHARELASSGNGTQTGS
jgi:hypothetical protein